MEYLALPVVRVLEQTSKLSCKSVDHGKVEWTEVFVEWVVGEVAVDVEKECIFIILRWLSICDPVQLVYRYYLRLGKLSGNDLLLMISTGVPMTWPLGTLVGEVQATFFSLS